MKKKKPCESCEIKGYSSEICKVHYKKVAKGDVPEDCPYHVSIKEVGKSAAVGAGVGVAATVIGISAVPAAALKALFGHVAAVKVSAGAGGGVTGAGVNAFRKAKKYITKKKGNVKKKPHIPLIL